MISTEDTKVLIGFPDHENVIWLVKFFIDKTLKLRFYVAIFNHPNQHLRFEQGIVPAQAKVLKDVLFCPHNSCEMTYKIDFRWEAVLFYNYGQDPVVWAIFVASATWTMETEPDEVCKW